MHSVLTALFVLSFQAHADDWPQWGGPHRDLVWREGGIVETLPANDPKTGMLPRMWTAKIGAGYAGPAVADGRVFVTDRLADDNLERVLCFDAATGNEIWKHPYKAPYSISYPLGPRATPTVDGDRVYVLGAVGHLFCFDTVSGDVIWQKHLPTDFGTKLPAWGMAAAPLVDGDQLIVLAGGKPGALVVSLNKHTGDENWRALDGKEPGYCPPVILEFGGHRQLIIWHPAAVVGLDPAGGKVLWTQPFPVEAGLSIPTPRKIGSRLFITSFYDGPLMLDLGKGGRSPRVLWQTAPQNTELKNDSLHAIMCTPIVTEDHIFGIGSYGEMRCLKTETGRMIWETHDATGPGRWWNAFLVPHGDRVVLCNEQGEIIFATLSGDGYQELSRAKLIEPTQPIQRRMTVWSHPAFAMGSVFARNDGELIRIDLAERH
ncbi:MAG: PQQ-like beta-propeller repeat protein [Planctomycetes bacterium]|nr:PQQ-like beta-propeller repeat protein [Planctomycetota bacterium]